MILSNDLSFEDPNKNTITIYQNYISKLYSEINKQRSFSDIYRYVHLNIGYLTKTIEIDQNDKSKFISLLSWFFSMSTCLNINALEALIKKFPGICPYCLQSTCICVRTNKKPPIPMAAYEIQRFIDKSIDYEWKNVTGGFKLYNLDETVKFISNIYPVNEIVWKFAGYQIHLLKIHQELTEINEAYNFYSKHLKSIDAIREEVGDVFAWTLGAWAIRYPNESLDKAFMDQYIDGCPVCHSFPCICDLEDTRPATLLDFGKIAEVKFNIEHYFKHISDYSEEFKKLSILYSNVLEEQKMPIVWATLRETKEVLQMLVKTITSVDRDGETTVALFSTLEIIDSLLHKEGLQKPKDKYYDIFLSYANEDRDQARKIFDYLTDRKKEVFMAEKSISPGEDWESKIKRSLQISKMICVIASPSSNKSDWVKTETDASYYLDIPLLPILFRCTHEDLPEKLRKRQCIDFDEYTKIIDLLN